MLQQATTPSKILTQKCIYNHRPHSDAVGSAVPHTSRAGFLNQGPECVRVCVCVSMSHTCWPQDRLQVAVILVQMKWLQ